MLTRSLLLAGWRDLTRRPLHTGLMVAGVALGVAVAVAVDLAHHASRVAFERSTRAVVGRATHRVLGGPGGLDQDLLRRIRVEAGLRASAPAVEGQAVALDLGRVPLRLFGLDPASESPFRDHLGAEPFRSSDFVPFMTDPRAVVIGAAFARRHGLALGHELRVRAAGRVAALRVMGIVDAQDADAAQALDGLLLLDVGAAQELLGLPGRLTHIDLVASDAQAARATALLPPAARIVPASERATTAAQMTAAFRLNLTALSLLALVVGMFLVYNTVMFGVVQRRAVFATLRQLGATPLQIAALIVAEAACAAALGSTLGLALGYALGHGALDLVTRTINDLYFVVAVREAPLTPATAVKGLLLGTGAAVCAALAPAWEAARVEPAGAHGAAVFERRARAALRHLVLGGTALVLAGAAGLAAAAASMRLTFASLFALVLGLALLTPSATVVLMRSATPLLGLAAGTLGRLAARTVTRGVLRTGVAAAALMVAVSVSIGVTLMIASFRATVDHWLALSLRADIYVGGGSPGGGEAPALPPGLRARVAAVPGVGGVETARLVEVGSDIGPVHLLVTDASTERDAALYRLAGGSARDAWRQVLAGAVLASEPLANRHALAPGGARLRLLTDRGPQVFDVAGVYYDYSSERGMLLMHRSTYERFFDDRALTSLAVELLPGAELGATLEALRAELGDLALPVTPNAALRRSALRIFDRTFAVTEALRILAVVVAFIGVWSALMALQVERTRELATLLALGLTQRQLWLLTVLETGLVGAAAGLLACPTGALLAAILVEIVNLRSFGWTMTLQLDPAVFARALALAVGAAVLAGVYPVLRLGRSPLAAALRRE